QYNPLLIIPLWRHATSTLFPYTTLFRSNSHALVEPPAEGRWLLRRDPSLPAVDLDVTGACPRCGPHRILRRQAGRWTRMRCGPRSEEHTSELQSPYDLVCRHLLEKKKNH